MKLNIGNNINSTNILSWENKLKTSVVENNLYMDENLKLIAPFIIQCDNLAVHKNSIFIAPLLKTINGLNLKQHSTIYIPSIKNILKINLFKECKFNGIKIDFRFQNQRTGENMMPILKRQLAKAKCINWLKSIQ